MPLPLKAIFFRAVPSKSGQWSRIPVNNRSLSIVVFGMLLDRGPKTHPKSRNTKRTARLREHLRKVRANFCLLPCDASQEPDGNCSHKLVQMNFFILGEFFRVDFPPLTRIRPPELGVLEGGGSFSHWKPKQTSGSEEGVITKGVFSLEKSLESLKSLNSLESLEYRWHGNQSEINSPKILFCFRFRIDINWDRWSFAFMSM